VQHRGISRTQARPGYARREALPLVRVRKLVGGHGEEAEPWGKRVQAEPRYEERTLAT
jgi:hypothetical protein